MVAYGDLLAACHAVGLDIFGGFHPGPGDGAPDGCGSLLMLGPLEPGFWAGFTQSGEYLDEQPDPMDRWSRRVIGQLAEDLGAQALFPFGGPPFQPFIGWAMRTGRAWQSPAGMLVHDGAGLMVSYRGALGLADVVDLPALPDRPCETCSQKPCLTACPVNALSAATGYDVAACHGFLDGDAGGDCMEQGCAARRVCPVSQSYGRVAAQSAFHMRSFHK